GAALSDPSRRRHTRLVSDWSSDVCSSDRAHLFIDPPDAGYGRLRHDRVDYAAAVERWLARWGHHPDVAVLTTADLAEWWLMREQVVSDLSWRHENGGPGVGLAGPPHPDPTLGVQR